MRILHVEADPSSARLLACQLATDDTDAVEVRHAATLALARQALLGGTIDAVVVDLNLPDSRGLTTFTRLAPLCRQIPVLVLARADEVGLAARAVALGACDYLVKGTQDGTTIVARLRGALAARRKAVPAGTGPAGDDHPLAEPPAAPRPRRAGEDQRMHPRYLLVRPVHAIAVRDDGQPDPLRSSEGFSLDLSIGGIGVQLAPQSDWRAERMLLGLEAGDGQTYFATVDVRYALEVPGGLRLGCRFAAGRDELLSTENLIPQFDFGRSAFCTGIPDEALRRWGELGVVRPMLLDRVLVCPECRGLPTFRYGCKACGSVQLATAQMIHHFACAHVGHAADFEHSGTLRCPKCRLAPLVVGTDFEYLSGPYRCLACNWSDTDLEKVGQCLRCRLLFPLEQAREEELIGYHANRLDPLALLAHA
jgi:DNA-binding response OmpR family regulator